MRLGFVARALVAITFLLVAIAAPCRAQQSNRYKLPEQIKVIGLTATQEEDERRLRGGFHGLLMRELARQALLIAARDESGLSTRDMALGEALPGENEPGQRTFSPMVTGGIGSNVRLHVSEGPTFSPKQLPFSETVNLPNLDEPYAMSDTLDYFTLSQELEALSVGKLSQRLKRIGGRGTANRPRKDLRLPAGIELELREMNLFSQFSAVRQIHALHRAEGESPDTLAGLVRGYANLAQLTSFHWRASHKVFMARALLYAQRLVRTDQGSCWSLWHRGYAFGLSGLHALALSDLKAAASLPDDTARPAPPWLPLIEAYCRYDGPAATQVTAPEVAELAAMISFLIVEHSESNAVAVRAGQKSLETIAECYPIYSSLARRSGLAHISDTTVTAPRVLQRTLARRLQSIPGLPPKALAELHEEPEEETVTEMDAAWACGEDRMNLVRALNEAGQGGRDRGEPSWSALGAMLHDMTFQHVLQRMMFLSTSLAVPRSELEAMLPAAQAAVEGHPYVPLLVCTMGLNRDSSAAINELVAKVAFVDAEINMGRFLSSLFFAKHGDTDPTRVIWRKIFRRADHIAQDLEMKSRMGGEYAAAAHVLRAVSPFSPQAVGYLTTADPAFTALLIRDWEQQFGDHIGVLKKLGDFHAAAGQYPDAVRCYEKYVALSPDYEGYTALAEMHWKQNQFDRWKSVLEASLEHEDLGLDHARTRVKLAQFHMDRGELQQALPYAEAAAATGASWAVICAEQCHEKLEHWEAAEQLVRANAERYDSQQFQWYFWCRRTGRGDLTAAQQRAELFVSQLAEAPSPNALAELTTYWMLSGQTEKARENARQWFSSSSHPLAAIRLALFLDETHAAAARDAALADAVVKAPLAKQRARDEDPRELVIVQWMINAYAGGQSADALIASLETTFQALADNRPVQGTLGYAAGTFFQRQGQFDLARRYYERSLQASNSHLNAYILSSIALQSLVANGESQPSAPEPAQAEQAQ